MSKCILRNYKQQQMIYCYTSLRSLLHFKKKKTRRRRRDTISVKGPSTVTLCWQEIKEKKRIET